MTWKLYLLMSGGGAVAAYALSLTSPFAPPAQVARPQATTAPQTATVDIQALADGLSERMEVERRYRAPARDAFRFGGSTPAPVEIAPAATLPPPEPLPVLPPTPPFGLFGVMGEADDRTAMLSSLGGVTFAAEGDTVGGVWRVVEIGQASVTLESLDGARTTLRLFGAGAR